MSGIAPFGCTFPKGVVRFYPNNSKSLPTFLSKAFRLRFRASITIYFRISIALKQRVTAFVCLSLYRSKARKQF
jgi:hypothetical protein